MEWRLHERQESLMEVNPLLRIFPNVDVCVSYPLDLVLPT